MLRPIASDRTFEGSRQKEKTLLEKLLLGAAASLAMAAPPLSASAEPVHGSHATRATWHSCPVGHPEIPWCGHRGHPARTTWHSCPVGHPEIPWCRGGGHVTLGWHGSHVTRGDWRG